MDTTTTAMDSSLAYINSLTMDSEAVIIQRHLARLQRHISCLEQANARRSSREMILYPVVFGYLAWHVAKWLLGNGK